MDHQQSVEKFENSTWNKAWSMGHQQSSVEKFEKFTWNVENFSRLNKEIYFEPFVLVGYPWYDI